MTKTEVMLDALASQRNAAMDEVVHLTARIAELVDEIATLKAGKPKAKRTRKVAPESPSIPG